MKIGIIGAGKMGFTLGKHFSEAKADDINFIGYYSKTKESAKAASEFTGSNFYNNMDELVLKSDIVFLTVQDCQIENVVQNIKSMNIDLHDKIFCHTSGALSSELLSEICEGCYGYSVHPIYAVSSKLESYIGFSNSFITIEGHEKYIDLLCNIFIDLGHKVKIISSADKVKYHSAAVFSSNLVIGLYSVARGLLGECGFSEYESDNALKPLFINNANRLYDTNCMEALTGPVERCDISTVEKHMNTISGDNKELYKMLSKELVNVAEKKHRINNTLDSKNYDELRKILE